LWLILVSAVYCLDRSSLSSGNAPFQAQVTTIYGTKGWFKLVKTSFAVEPSNPLAQLSHHLRQTLDRIETPVLAFFIGELLEEVIAKNDEMKLADSAKRTVFYGSRPSTVSISEYIEELAREAKLTNAGLLMVMIYLDRLVEEKLIYSTSVTAHRLLVAAVATALKYIACHAPTSSGGLQIEDISKINQKLAEISGMSVYDLNELELEFIFAIDKQIHASDYELNEYFLKLRGWADKYVNDRIEEGKLAQTEKKNQ